MRYNARMKKSATIRILNTVLAAFTTLTLASCTPSEIRLIDPTPLNRNSLEEPQYQPEQSSVEQSEKTVAVEEQEKSASPETEAGAERPPVDLAITKDFRDGFVHGDKGSAYQKYIVLHDTEGTADPASVISWWDSNGSLVASHFVVGMDGSVYQCVSMDKIAHHAGYGNTGNNAYYGVTEDGRDDMRGTVWVGNWASDYGMNAWSIGIEMVHVGGSGYYPQAQLDALDSLIAYIDYYYGFESTIIDHKAWRSGNSDTSPEFSQYLYNYQTYRQH